MEAIMYSFLSWTCLQHLILWTIASSDSVLQGRLEFEVGVLPNWPYAIDALWWRVNRISQDLVSSASGFCVGATPVQALHSRQWSSLHPEIQSVTSLLCGWHYFFCTPQKSTTLKLSVITCIDDIICWMASIRLKLNPAKSEFLWCAMVRQLCHIDNSVSPPTMGILCLQHL